MRIASRLILVRNGQLLVMHRLKFGHEYYTLIGGGVNPGETPVHTLLRETREETGIMIANPKLVYIEKTSKPYGDQYIYRADYVSGEPVLATDSTEAKIHNMGQNLYEPKWLNIDKLPSVPFLSKELKNKLVHDLEFGFPETPDTFMSVAEYEEKINEGDNTNGTN